MDYKHLRMPFAIMKGKVIFGTLGEERSTRQWLYDDHDVDTEEFETVPRGCMDSGRIVFFIGDQYRPLKNIPHALLPQIGGKWLDTFHRNCDVPVFNGVIPGTPGEEWHPIERICTLTVTSGGEST